MRHKLFRAACIGLAGAVVLLLLAAPGTGRRAQAEPTTVLAIDERICTLLTGDVTGCQAMSQSPDIIKRVVKAATGLNDEALDKRDGREDGRYKLLPEDFASIDLDADQLFDERGVLWILAFVDDDEPIWFETSSGKFALAVPGGPFDDEFVCAPTGDILDSDCNGVSGEPSDDGVVPLALRSDHLAGIAPLGPGTVEVLQGGTAVTLDFTVVGEPDAVELITVESVIQNGIKDITARGNGKDDDKNGMEDGSGPVTAGTGDCNDDLDNDADGLADGNDPECKPFVDDASEDVPDGALDGLGECPLDLSEEAFVAALGMPEKTLVFAQILDREGTPLTGALVGWWTDDPDKATFAGPLVPSVDTGPFGLASPNILCGTSDPGTVTVTARIAIGFDPDTSEPCYELDGCLDLDPYVETDKNSAEFTVVGEPASITLMSEPASLVCDGVNASTLTATVTDSEGSAVADGQPVRFDVRVLGTADPITTTTTGGAATSTITPLAGAAGVPVRVTAGDAEASILVACEEAPPPPPPPPPPPTEPPTGVIAPPTTGSGGQAPLESSAPWWAVTALTTGALGLASIRLALRHRAR